MSSQIVIADASCLIALENIGELSILRELFENILITPEVAAEFGSQIPKWISLRAVPDSKELDMIKAILDDGEATAIALALNIPDSLLIIDERKGRKMAADLGIEIIGTVGIVIKAINAGIVSSPATIVERLEEVGFRLSDDLKRTIMTSIQ